MNRKGNALSAIGIIAVMGAGCASPSTQLAQSVSEPEHFRIEVGFTAEEIVLKCTRGCAWTDLAWGPVGPAFDAVAVDNFGMTSPSRDLQNRDTDFAAFLFTIQRTENGVQLRGVEGTSWTELSWGCASCSVAVDRRGMV